MDARVPPRLKPETTDAWIKKWMLDLPDHVVYLAQARLHPHHGDQGLRFVDKVPYTAAPGCTVRTVVSDRGVYEKAGEHGELARLRLFDPRRYFPGE